jgi:proteic killer suppression protein
MGCYFSVKVLSTVFENQKPIYCLIFVVQHITITKMIKSFKHKGIKEFFETGSKSGIQPHHESKLRRQLGALNVAQSEKDMNLPGWNLHPLKDELTGHFSVWVNGNWRLTFSFEGQDAVLVDYQDYH